MPRPRKTTPKLTTNKALVTNAAYQQVCSLFTQTDMKHNQFYDFGFPGVITFPMYYEMYSRNGIARAGVQHAVNKTWREYPSLLENDETHDTTTKEGILEEFVDRLSFWQKLREADERSRVGEYGALVFRFADGKQPSEPITGRLAGPESLVEVIPCYQAQLQASAWDNDPKSATYGQPTMYLFNESQVDPKTGKNRTFTVHPDRVHIWSKDGSIYGDPVLRPGYNDLLTMQKIIGAGGEGFWKNAKSAPILNTMPDASLESLATMLGTDVAGIADAMDAVVEGWQKGFDQLLMLQGIDAKTLSVTLPQPEEFIAGALQSFAASINEPLKILIGSQSGERASTEDAKEWDSTIMSRRENYVKPNLRRLIDKLVRFGVLPTPTKTGGRWYILWTDLTEDSTAEKLEKAAKMAAVNKEMLGVERVFTADEIREAAGYMPLEDNGLLPEDEADAQE